ncbi:MAG: hypothetical protein L6R39_000035 [Caloplaca ligustica]|nr:MAG: hypothetical protein L6R39_000035 [Caloplaca ligustica]
MSPPLVTTSQRGKSAIELEAHGMVDMTVSMSHTADFAGGETDREIGTCKACKKGVFQMCDNALVNGETKGGGCTWLLFSFNVLALFPARMMLTQADAEYCMLRAEAAVRVPSHVDAAKYAPILCAGVTVFNSMRNMNISPGATVAIQGLGGLGHLAIQYASKFGYRVVALSRDSKKEKFARDLGADDYIDGSKGDIGEALQKLGGASLIVSTAPSVDAITPLLKGLGIFGKLLILSSKSFL